MGCGYKCLGFCRNNEKHGKGTHCTKMGADGLADNTSNAPEFVSPNPKVLDFNEKKASLRVCSAWFKPLKGFVRECFFCKFPPTYYLSHVSFILFLQGSLNPRFNWHLKCQKLPHTSVQPKPQFHPIPKPKPEMADTFVPIS